MVKRICLLTVLLVMLMMVSATAAILPAPAHDIYVVDNAAMLNADDKNKVLAIGRELDTKYHAQAVVVTLDTLDGADIDQYANELFNDWGIGDRSLNNGVLLLIAKNDRKFRIEVGYGLEQSINNAYAAEVLDGMKERFRAEDYSSAIVGAYIKLVSKVYEANGDTFEEELTWWETLCSARERLLHSGAASSTVSIRSFDRSSAASPTTTMTKAVGANVTTPCRSIPATTIIQAAMTILEAAAAGAAVRPTVGNREIS